MPKPNILLFYGQDPFSLAQEWQRWKRVFVQKHGDSNFEELEGKNLTVEQIIYAAQALPFLGEKRLIALKNFLQDASSDTQKDLIPILEYIPESTVLVFIENGQPDGRSSLFKALQKEATLKRYEPPEGYQLTDWILKRAQTHGAQISSGNAEFLSQRTGKDLWRLDNELQKLSLYAKGEAINKSMIEALVSGSLEQSIFAFTDFLSQRDHASALKTLKALEEQGEEAPYIFAMMARQIRLLLEVKALTEEHQTEPQMARQMGAHPFVIKNTLRQSRHFTKEALTILLQELLTIDRRLKTGLIPLKAGEEAQYWLALERVLLKV